MQRASLPIGAAAVMALSGVQAAAATTYSAARTSTCLVAAGAEIRRGKDAAITADFPEVRDQLFWHIGSIKNPRRGEIIMFTRDSAAATHLAARLLRAAHSGGLTRAEALRSFGKSGNAVWTSNGFTTLNAKFTTLNAKRAALLKHCLR